MELPAQATGHILVVDDEPGMREFLDICLQRSGHRVTLAANGGDALKLLSENQDAFDILITDLTMPGVDGMEILRHTCAAGEGPLVIMITAFASTDTAIEAMKLGAFDYLIKPFKVDEIQVVVNRALSQRALTQENQRLRAALQGVDQLDKMVARSKPMLKIFDLVRKAACVPTNILIRGESGTGKELVARAIHQLSDYSEGPWIPVNCGAIPDNLMESELFGHKKGSFSGAFQDRKGMFESARNGTIFLDEIGELGMPMQVKLLRILQERTVRPVGSSEEYKVNCRVIAATNRDLEAAVAAGEFRQDLYFRLNVIQLILPPLRHRIEDIPVLVDRFFASCNAQMGGRLSGISPEAMDRFLRYSYPGNVRELQNLVERAVALETESFLSANHLPAANSVTTPIVQEDEITDDGVDLDATLTDLETKLIHAALRKSGGVRKEAASLLKISLRSLRYRLQKLGIEINHVEDACG